MTFLICTPAPWRLNLSFLKKWKSKDESFSSRMVFLTPLLGHLLTSITATPPSLCPSLSTAIQSQAPTWVLEYTEPEISGTPVLLEVTDTPERGGNR